MSVATIHVYLPEERVDSWYPVRAEHLGGDRYRILEEPAEDPVLQFHRGDVVRCRHQKLGKAAAIADALVAYEISN